MRKRDSLIVLLVFIFLSLGFFWRYFFKGQVPFPANLLVASYSPWRYYQWAGYPNGPPNKPIGFDVIRSFYPYRQLTITQLKAGQWPLWNPYNFSGNIHLATYQTAVFYPLNFLYFILPLIDAWSLLVIIQPILAGWFMYLFLREIGLSLKASFFGSLAFAFSGWMLAWSEESLVIEHSALWLPLILYATEKTMKKPSAGHTSLLVFSAACSILAGFLQSTIYVFVAVFSWLVFRLSQEKKNRFKKLAFLGTGFLFSLLISAAQILPAIEAYLNSARAGVDARFVFEQYLLPAKHLITFLVPDFWGNPGSYNYFGSGFYHEKVIYFGIPALLLALFALISETKNSILSFFQRFSFIVLLLAFDPFGWLLYFSRLPLISTMIPVRITFLSTFGFCVLAGFGIDLFWQRQNNWRDWKIVFVVISLVFAGLWWLVIKRLPQDASALISLRNLILPTGFFLGSAAMILVSLFKQRLKPLSFFGLVFLSLVSSFYFANKFLYFSERKFVFPEVGVISQLKKTVGLNRIWGYGNAYLEKNMNAFYQLYSPDGYEGLFSGRYGQLLYATETAGKITDRITRSDAGLKQASEREGILDNQQRQKLLSLLAVKYIMEAKVGEGKEWKTTSERFPPELFNLAWEDNSFRIWDYQEALPRAFLVSDYLIETDRQKIADYLFNEDFDLRKTVILEENPESTIEPCNHETMENSARITKYTPNKVEISVNSVCPGLLFLSDTDYPGWRAVVRPLTNYGSAQQAKIYRADYAFRAVAVPAGEHRIIFSYRPKVFDWGLGISCFSLLLFAGRLVFLRSRPNF